MKKFYVSIVGCLLYATGVSAQNFYWVGPSGGNWNSAGNWSATSGGSGGTGVPNGVGHNVIFDQNALVNVDLGPIQLNTFTVTNLITAKLYVVSGTPDISLLSTSSISPALKIDAGSRLEDSVDTDGITFSTTFASGAQGLINGVWYFSGNSAVTSGFGSTFVLPAASGQGNRVDVNGTIQFRNNTLTPTLPMGQEYLFFNGGSTYWLDRNGGTSPRATWNSNSTIKITGVTTSPPAINVGSLPEIGNLVFDCPAVAFSGAPMGWSLPNNLVIKGNLQFLNTNNRIIVLASNGSAFVNDFTYTVNGNFDIVGSSSKVAIANASNSNKTVTFQVIGNLNAGGNSFDLQVASPLNIVANPTTLKVAGNINHTAGTFVSGTTASSNNSVDLFVIELDGSSIQNVFSTDGSFDNSTNEVTFRMNNAAGATLTSPLAVGKIDFNTTNQGKLTTTSTNILTINNTGTHSLVVNSPSNTGFVNGPVRRRTANNVAYRFPTGKGSSLRYVEVVPNSSTLSTFESEYFNSPYSDLTVVPPLNGVSNLEYWVVTRVGAGSSAAVRLNLNGVAVPGATAGDGITVAKYNGIDWANARGSTGTIIIPGTSTTGSTTSDVLSSFGTGLFTFGYGPVSALPVNLLTFEARKASASSSLVNWSISVNSTPQKFEVLRSDDGRNFIPVGEVNASSGQYSYQFTDNSLPVGTSYYKLKLIDQNGSIGYSKVIAVFNGVKGVLITSLVPTVINSTARLNISSTEKGNMQIVISDMYGRIIQQQSMTIVSGNQELWLQLQKLPAGAYQLSGYMNGQRVGTIRFVKQ